MAKKKRRRRRHPQRPARPGPQAPGAPDEARGAAEPEVEATEAERPASRRAERKEEARRERERRIRQARRRQRTRRLVRWGIVLGAAGGVAAIVWFAQGESRRIQEEGASAAERISCTEVEEQESTLPNQHAEPYAQGEAGVPAFGGNHNPSLLPSEPKVYQQQPPEDQAGHNLEHGYVLVYYAADGDNALAEENVSALEDLVDGETEVLMAPYEGLAKPVYLVAWGARQACDPPEDASADDLTLVAEAFIEKWKNGDFAPEAAAS